MSVADMEFATAEVVTEAIKARIAHPIIGYTQPSHGLVSAVVERMAEDYQWKVEPEWLVFLPGVVPGLSAACRAYGAPGDEVMTNSPIYHHFLHIAQDAGKRLVDVPLKMEGDHWTYDLDAMERMVSSRTKILMLCSPHNPVGRVFNREELTRVAEFAKKHDLLIVSDEIHCALVLDSSQTHMPTACVDEQTQQRTITLMSPSKTFNCAGSNCSVAIIPDNKHRQQFKAAIAGVTGDIPPFSYAATEAAYRDGEAWRLELIDYLKEGYQLIEQAVMRWPGCRLTPLEATYLAWIDVSALGLENPQLFFEQEAKVGVSPGAQFGDARYIRLNFACQHSMLKQALEAMEKAIIKHQAAIAK